ncbi:sodium-dependent bicarbonate transport family permease [Salinarimonas sp. NSM]|uniref:sodium-dependent bicarbonate transport family permease n=1 Tax=Salinarimonas sp. NSM TaxID=3458003 RepID=UPI0040350B75
MLDLVLANLTSPIVLFFALGLAAALARSDLAVPDAVAKALALYLMMAIGFKGGASVAGHGVDARLIGAVIAGALLSFSIPWIAFQILRRTTKLPALDAAAVAAHYGSISIVTFVAASESVRLSGLVAEGYLVAVAAVMEAPAILTALWLAQRARKAAGRGAEGEEAEPQGALLREILLNGSIVLLAGAFVIGWITGDRGLEIVSPFLVAPFQGVLCLFLLDMGLVAGRGLRSGWRELKGPVLAFGLYMPLVGATLAALVSLPLGLSAGGTALLITLSASASYIAVPAAMRLALPEARPAIYLTLSLGVTFPFNLTLGIPLYIALAEALS